MPKVRYVFRVCDPEERLIKEQDILSPSANMELSAKQHMMLVNDSSAATDQWEFVRVDVLDPFLHEHEWKTEVGPYVYCPNCGVKGERVKGSTEVQRRKQWEAEYYNLCHEEKPKLSKPRFKK